MAGIIKAGGLRSPTALPMIPFQLGDVTERANSYLDEVRRQAETLAAKIVADAKEQARQLRQQADAQAGAIRQKAEEQGRAAALQAARQAAEQSSRTTLAQQLATLLPALQKTVDDIEQSKAAWLSHWEQSAVPLATAIAQRIVRRELRQQPEIAVELLREALELASGSGPLFVHLNPQDHAALRDHWQPLVEQLGRLAPPEIVADPTVSPGGCRVVTKFGEIDQRIETQLARIEEELLN